MAVSSRIDRPLIEREKRVLYGLVRHPEATDRELSDLLNIKLPTVTATRHRLMRSSYYMSRWVPNMRSVGQELISFALARFSDPSGFNERLQISHAAINSPGVVYAASTPEHEFMIIFSANFTEAQKLVSRLEIAYRERNFLDEEILHIPFPFETSEFSHFFDYSQLIEGRFPAVAATGEIDLEPLGQDFMPPNHFPAFGRPPLSRKEQIVIWGLTNSPTMTDLQLGRRIQASRMTIGKFRKKFIDQKILRKINIPSHRKLGYEVMVITYGRFNMTVMEGMKYYIAKTMSQLGPSIFTAFGRNNVLSVNLYENLDQYETAVEQFHDDHDVNSWFRGDPDRLVFEMATTNWRRNHAYAEAMEAVLDLQPEDFLSPVEVAIARDERIKRESDEDPNRI